MNGRKDVIKLYKNSITRKDAARISDGFVTDSRSQMRNVTKRIADIQFRTTSYMGMPCEKKKPVIFTEYNELRFYPLNAAGDDRGEFYVDCPHVYLNFRPNLSRSDVWFCMPSKKSDMDKLADVDGFSYEWREGDDHYGMFWYREVDADDILESIAQHEEAKKQNSI